MARQHTVQSKRKTTQKENNHKSHHIYIHIAEPHVQQQNAPLHTYHMCGECVWLLVVLMCAIPCCVSVCALCVLCVCFVCTMSAGFALCAFALLCLLLGVRYCFLCCSCVVSVCTVSVYSGVAGIP